MYKYNTSKTITTTQKYNLIKSNIRNVIKIAKNDIKIVNYFLINEIKKIRV